MGPSDQRVEVLPGPFEARIISSGTRAVRVVVSGELDLASAPQLDVALRQALAIANDVVLDLAQVRFIDSTGLYTILGAVREADSTGVTLRVSSDLRPQVARLFQLVGLEGTMPFADV